MRAVSIALGLALCAPAAIAQRADGWSTRVWLQWCQDTEKIDEAFCIGYLQGLAGANDFATMAKRPFWCAPTGTMNAARMKAIVLGDIIGKNRDLNMPFAWWAIAAMHTAYPCRTTPAPQK